MIAMKFSSMITRKDGSSTTSSVDVYEVDAKNNMLIYGYGGGNSVQVILTEEEVFKLRRWLSSQVTRINKNKKPA